MKLPERRVKIVLQGYLKDLLPGEIFLTGSTVWEILNGLMKQTKAFNVLPGEDRHVVHVLGFPSKESLMEPIGKDLKELILVPDFSGGKSGFFQVAIGAMLIAVAVFAPFAAAALPFGISGTIDSALTSMGLSLVLGGVISLLSPAPKLDTTTTAADPEASKYLGAGENTVAIGTRIPILIGRHKISGHYLSFDVDAKDVAV